MKFHSASQLNLSPWTRAVAGDTTGLRLPAGYFITGLARTGGGPWTLELWIPDETLGSRVLASHVVQVAADVRPRLLSLVDMAAIDEYERSARVVVTTDRDGWIESIETEARGA